MIKFVLARFSNERNHENLSYWLCLSLINIYFDLILLIANSIFYLKRKLVLDKQLILTWLFNLFFT
jgi:hypothetical protein